MFMYIFLFNNYINWFNCVIIFELSQSHRGEELIESI